MSEPQASNTVGSPTSRPVLIWLAEGDESHVKADLAQASEFLKVSPEAVQAAILSGDPVEGWFVDWEALPAKP